MIVNDIWGQIRIEPKYEKIINSKEFIDLKNKSQLGFNVNSNAIHNRYQHSIGTYFLAVKLNQICKSKFSDILNITEEDEEVIKLSALVHDIGHGPFSHVSESFLKVSHEEETIKILLDKKSEIHNIIIKEFGEKVLLKVINLLKNKEEIKKNNIISSNLSLDYIIEKLLCGGIDIDRIDYLYRDSKFVFDKTIPIKKGEVLEPNYMIECELKSGNSSGLYFINKFIKQFDFIYECNNSKKEIALEKIEKDYSKKIINEGV